MIFCTSLAFKDLFKFISSQFDSYLERVDHLVKHFSSFFCFIIYICYLKKKKKSNKFFNPNDFVNKLL